MGYPSVTTNLSIEHGVYSLGAVTNEYPESFGYSYTPSTSSMLNTGTNNLRIGLVKSYGDILYTSWRDDSSLTQKYGVDIVDNTSTSSLTADWTSLAFDNNEPSKYNNAGYIIATFEPLPVGATVRIKYKIDSGDWIYSSYAGTGDSYLICPIDKRFLSTQFGLDITATTLAPEISSCYMWIDTLPTERPIGG